MYRSVFPNIFVIRAHLLSTISLSLGMIFKFHANHKAKTFAVTFPNTDGIIYYMSYQPRIHLSL